MPRKPPPQDSRLSAVSPSRATAFTPTHKIPDGDFSTQITYHAAERIKWSAFSATKMAQLCRVIFSKQYKSTGIEIPVLFYCGSPYRQRLSRASLE